MSGNEEGMSFTATTRNDVARVQNRGRSRPTIPARYFFGAAAVTMLTIMVAGFQPYYLRGEGLSGRTISPQLATLVFVHGAAMTAWLMLFLVQSLLVPARRLRIHMKLGWGGFGVGLLAAGSGFMLAVESVRPVPAIPFWGMAYRQFLLVMLIEVALFTLFVLAGGALSEATEDPQGDDAACEPKHSRGCDRQNADPVPSIWRSRIDGYLRPHLRARRRVRVGPLVPGRSR
jgi:hypothetical protein